MKGLDDKILSIAIYPFSYVQYFFGKYNKSSNKTILWNYKSQKVLFIIPHWMGSALVYKKLINKLKNDYTIVIYKVTNKLLSANIDKTLKHFEEACKSIIHTANYLRNKGYSEFSIIGNSLTCCLALIVANSNKNFTKIIINLAGSDLAQCFWESENLLIKNLKNRLESDGVGLTMLKKHWKSLAPINNIKNLNKRKILVFIAKNDKMIHYRYGLEFLNSMKKENINFDLHIDYIFGHYLSGFKQIVFPNRIMKFLES